MMERLLKIVEGPMKGAEIALVSGTRVKVGSGEDCDIVVADASLPAVAFELDVGADAVTLITPDGETVDMRDFEIREFGSTAVAVGPAEGAWGELFRPEPKAASAEPDPSESPAADADRPESASEEPKSRKRRGGCLFALLILFILILLLGAFGYWQRERLPAWTAQCRERMPALAERVKSMFRQTPVEVKDTPPPPTVREIAAAHGLRVEDRDGQPCLVGNLRRRTERMAIRALALASDRTVKFDLTDDQSLKTAVADTLYLASGGRLTVASVTNRVAAIEGAVTGPAELANVLRMLNQDVPQLVSCETSRVRAQAAEIPVPQTAEKAAGSPAAAPKPTAARAVAPMASMPNLPVAGILTKPYPCVVLVDGSRCLEGARIGRLVLERISAEELVFRSGSDVVRWRP